MERRRRPRALLPLLVVALCACGGPAPPPPPDGGAAPDLLLHRPIPDARYEGSVYSDWYRDGQRLRAWYLLMDDGTALPNGYWFDSALGVTCLFRPWDGDAVRCIPEFPNGQLLSHYSDDQCTKPILSVRGDGLGRLWPINRGAPDSCTGWQSDAWAVYLAKSVYDGPRYLKNGGCRQDTTATDRSFYVVEAQPPSMFVKGTPRTVQLGGRLVGTAYDGEDGSQQNEPAVLQDSQRHASCVPTGPLCLPDPVRLGENSHAFSDAACTLRYVPRWCPATKAFLDGPIECGGQVRSVAPAESTFTGYISNGSSCDPGGTVTGRLLGDPVPAGEFVAIRPGSVGSTRIRLSALTVDTGEAVKFTGLYDQLFQTRCSNPPSGTDNARSPSGSALCLPMPYDEYSRLLFLDPACSAPCVEPPTPPCTESPRFALLPRPPNAEVQLYELGPRRTAAPNTLFVRDNAGQCVPLNNAASSTVAPVQRIPESMLVSYAGPMH